MIGSQRCACGPEKPPFALQSVIARCFKITHFSFTSKILVSYSSSTHRVERSRHVLPSCSSSSCLSLPLQCQPSDLLISHINSTRRREKLSKRNTRTQCVLLGSHPPKSWHDDLAEKLELKHNYLQAGRGVGELFRARGEPNDQPHDQPHSTNTLRSDRIRSLPPANSRRSRRRIRGGGLRSSRHLG